MSTADAVEVVRIALRQQKGLIWSERAINRQAQLAVDALRVAGMLKDGQPASITTNPVQPPRREPNCKPGDPEGALGLVHAWKLVIDHGPGDIYQCERCGVTDVD